MGILQGAERRCHLAPFNMGCDSLTVCAAARQGDALLMPADEAQSRLQNTLLTTRGIAHSSWDMHSMSLFGTDARADAR